MFVNITLIILAYLVGSLNFSIILSRVFKTDDPRAFGSQNPGATNMLRGSHPQAKVLALLTLLLDAFKGVVVVFFGAYMSLPNNMQLLMMLAVFLGHLYPIFFQFKGGKGVATLLGIVLAFNMKLGVVVMLVWLVAFLTGGKRSALAALMSLATLPVATYLLLEHIPTTALMGVLATLSMYRHKANIKRLFEKKEPPVL